MEVTHTGVLRQFTGKWELRKVDGGWVNPWGEVVQEAALTQSEMTYIGRQQVTVVQWVVLCPIFEFCA